MKTVQLGRTDIDISSILMGTWQTGKAMWVGIDDGDSIKALRQAFDSGITTFDTAEVYGKGHSERIVGQALSAVRSQVVIATKVFANHLQYDQVIDACHRSLKNLGTDVIDLYQIHWPPGAFGSKKIPLQEPMRALIDLKQQGKIRAIGVSNFSRQQVEEILQYGRIDSLQPPYSLFWRHVETDAMPCCRENDITILAYSPMAQGLLTGKYGPGHVFEKGDHRSRNKLFAPEHRERVQSALERLQPIAERNNISMGQLALAWVISHPNTCAIAGARNAEQSSQNAQAGEVTLSDADLAEMDAISQTVNEHLEDNAMLWNFG